MFSSYLLQPVLSTPTFLSVIRLNRALQKKNLLVSLCECYFQSEMNTATEIVLNPSTSSYTYSNFYEAKSRLCLTVLSLCIIFSLQLTFHEREPRLYFIPFIFFSSANEFFLRAESVKSRTFLAFYVARGNRRPRKLKKCSITRSIKAAQTEKKKTKGERKKLSRKM